MQKDFEILPHTADLRIRVYGKTLEEFFHNALVGMFQSIRPKTAEIGCEKQRGRLVCKTLSKEHEIEVTADDINTLLIDFLSEALYLSDVNDEAYLDVDFNKVTDKSISARVKGVKVFGFDGGEIKAVTYHGLDIKKTDNGWQAEVIFDI